MNGKSRKNREFGTKNPETGKIKKIEEKDLPLYGALQAHSQSGACLFSMPGHKGRGLLPLDWGMDITELPGFDNLHQAGGVIAEAQQKAAALRGADEAFFLVNGSSGGVMAAVLAVAGPGEEMLLARNAHVSAFRGLVLSGADPVYAAPRVAAGIPRELPVEAVEAALLAHPRARGLLVVSPTYEGFCSDIPALARLCHARGLPLIVDAAHGAHLGYHPAFPADAFSQGADVVVESWHKTLPAPTQTAVLFFRRGRVDEHRLRGALRLLQSTSPSYLLLAALDGCRAFLETEGPAAFEAYATGLLALRRRLEKLQNIPLLPTDDPGKLVFLAGYPLEEALRRRGVYLEAAWPGHALAMTSVADRPADFARLAEALEELDKDWPRPEAAAPAFSAELLTPPRRILSPRDAFFAPGETVPAERAAGHMALDFLIPYPPGIPLVCPGEELTPAALGYLEQVLRQGGSVLGMEAGIRVKKE